jgi:hypothetical protein
VARVTPLDPSCVPPEATTARARPVARGLLPGAALVALKGAVSAWAFHVGFTHVSDDDYARVTIAQTFAHTPRLDPSATSWLPFPFWLTGEAMAFFGRSIAVAQGVALVSGIAGALVVHRALLRAGTTAWAAWTGVALAMSAPWSVWLGVATVPEALSASLVAAAALFLTRRNSRPWGALCLLLATLSRYEAWPVALVFAAVCLMSAVWPPKGASRRSRSTDVAPAAVALLGPLAWMAWNAHAHGDPLHFVARVAAFRMRVAPASTGTWTAYPAAFLGASPGSLMLLALGAPALAFDRDLRRRWALPMLAMLALALFLVEGALHDGAPTHHPERALLAFFWLGTAFGIDGLRSLSVRFVWGRPKREAWFVGAVTTMAVAWGLAWPARVADHPARSPDEDRSTQLARGDSLRARNVPHVVVIPCAYEHFATIAAFEAPERVTVEPQAVGATGPCPAVVEE